MKLRQVYGVLDIVMTEVNVLEPKRVISYFILGAVVHGKSANTYGCGYHIYIYIIFASFYCLEYNLQIHLILVHHQFL
jgi:hypothetical protein